MPLDSALQSDVLLELIGMKPGKTVSVIVEPTKFGLMAVVYVGSALEMIMCTEIVSLNALNFKSG